jgi:hypothetical protein
MSLFDALRREICEAELEDREILRLRITPEAIAGSPVTVPVTPERARLLRLLMYPGETVDADPELVARFALELLIHPRDWYALLCERGRDGHFVVEPSATAASVARVLGIPVSG